MKIIVKLLLIGVVGFLNSTAIGQTTNAPDSNSSESCILSGTDGETNDHCIEKSDLLGGLDLAAPTNPLFTLMGTTPESVITPKTGDDLMLSLLPRAVDAFGGDNYALALEVNPGLLMLPDRIAPADLGFFNDKPVYGDTLSTARLLSRLTTTILAVRKTGDVDSTQYGFGLSFNHDTKNPLINNGEYRSCVSKEQSKLEETGDAFQEATKLMRTALGNAGVATNKRTKLAQKLLALESTETKQILSVLKSESVDISGNAEVLLTFLEEVQSAKKKLDPYRKPFNDLVVGCAKEVSKWNRNVYAGGLAVYRTESGDVTNPASENGDVTGWGSWASLAFETAIGESEGQFIFHGRYNENLVRERSSEGSKLIEHVDGWSLGGRYTHMLMKRGSASRFRNVRGFIEAAYTNEEFGSINDEFWQAGIGAEFQIRNDLYFQFVIGDTFDSEIDRSAYLSGQFKWSFSKTFVQ